MNTIFEYNGKRITTPNLEKKLKQMKISLDDIVILGIQEEKKESKFKWEYEGIKEWRYYKHPDSDIIHCCLIDIGTNPTKKELFKNLMWDESSKTGVRKFTNEYVNELCEYGNI